MKRHPRTQVVFSAPRCRSGFTLVEVLVAMVIMAIGASLAWQGLDGMLRAREASLTVLDSTLRLNTVIAQWEQDLAALHDVGVVPAISFDGQTLRLTRKSDGGVVLVAWSVRAGKWQRWTGPTYGRTAELSEGWLRSQQLLGNEAGHLTLADASEWNIYFYRGNAWTNAQSTGDLAQPASASASAPAPSGRELLPSAVRMVITLGAGVLTRDIALGPGA